MAVEVVLPEITYPLTIDTIGKEIVLGRVIMLHCKTCDHYGTVDLMTIARRHGADYPNGEHALRRVCSCARCLDAGRPAKNIGFTIHPRSEPDKRWAMPR